MANNNLERVFPVFRYRVLVSFLDFCSLLPERTHNPWLDVPLETCLTLSRSPAYLQQEGLQAGHSCTPAFPAAAEAFDIILCRERARKRTWSFREKNFPGRASFLGSKHEAKMMIASCLHTFSYRFTGCW